MLLLGLIGVCIPIIIFLGAVVETQYEKKTNFAIFQSKIVKNYGHGNLEIGHMQLFFYENYISNPNGSFSQMG